MKRIRTILARVSTIINKVVETFIFFLGMIMATVMAVQVFYRYVLNHSLFWSEEFGRICLVWLSFLGATAAFKRHMHIGIDFLTAKFPQKLKKTVELFSAILSIIFFGVLFFFGVSFVKFVSAQKTAAIGLPMSIPYSIIPISGLIFAVHAANFIAEIMCNNTNQIVKNSDRTNIGHSE